MADEIDSDKVDAAAARLTTTEEGKAAAKALASAVAAIAAAEPELSDAELRALVPRLLGSADDAGSGDELASHVRQAMQIKYW